MKKGIITLGIFVCLGLSLGAQTGTIATTSTSESASQAEIKFDKELHDFGTIP
jgi:hypothetical protein